MVSAPAGVLSPVERPRRAAELVAFVDWFIVWVIAIFAKFGCGCRIRTCSSIGAPASVGTLKC